MSLTEGISENANVLLSPERLLLEVPQGLHNSMAITWLIIWYISSASTLFSNKFILSSYQGDAFSLGKNISNNFVCLFIYLFFFYEQKKTGMNQLLLSVLCAYVQIQVMNKFFTSTNHKASPPIKNVFRDMIYIGAFRCMTVIFGLVALKYIAVSFVATIKSSTPLFTVIISRIMLGERTGHWTKFSMIPITIGLALCSSFELSFNLFGFFCALGTNIAEW